MHNMYYRRRKVLSSQFFFIIYVIYKNGQVFLDIQYIIFKKKTN